jgi:hypothetical protein
MKTLFLAKQITKFYLLVLIILVLSTSRRNPHRLGWVIENITWLRGNTKFILSIEQDISRENEAKDYNILFNTRSTCKFLISKLPCSYCSVYFRNVHKVDKTSCIVCEKNIGNTVWLIVWSCFTENHRTQTSHDDALIVKLFAFQFVNSYASLYYIAFFRGVSIQVVWAQATCRVSSV